MKCPRCKSNNTKKVSVTDRKWKIGHQRCKDCGHQDVWEKFCDPPFEIKVLNMNQILLPGIDFEVDGYV